MLSQRLSDTNTIINIQNPKPVYLKLEKSKLEPLSEKDAALIVTKAGIGTNEIRENLSNLCEIKTEAVMDSDLVEGVETDIESEDINQELFDEMNSDNVYYVLSEDGKSFIKFEETFIKSEVDSDVEILEEEEEEEPDSLSAHIPEHFRADDSLEGFIMVEEPATCSFCSKQFLSEEFLEKHIADFHKLRHWCELCGELFRSQRSLKTHVAQHNQETTELCEQCGMSVNRAQFKRHMQSHARSRSSKKPKPTKNDSAPLLNCSYPCKFCGINFTTFDLMRDHARGDHAALFERPYGCATCGKSFISDRDLKLHYLIHIKKKIHGCEFCGKSFVQRSHLDNHLRLHVRHGQRPETVVIDVLDEDEFDRERAEVIMAASEIDESVLEEGTIIIESFENEDVETTIDLKTEMVDEKRFECDICGARFSQRPTLAAHRPKHTQGATDFTCVRCKQSYDDSETLKLHVATHHREHRTRDPNDTTRPKPVDRHFACTFCGKTYKTYMGAQNHIRASHTLERPYECEQCGKRFIQDQHLKIHLMTHTGERPYACDECGKRFVQKPHLKSHMRLHTGEKPYECRYCHRRFRHLTTIRDHEKIHTGEHVPRKRKRNN